MDSHSNDLKLVGLSLKIIHMIIRMKLSMSTAWAVLSALKPLKHRFDSSLLDAKKLSF